MLQFSGIETTSEWTKAKTTKAPHTIKPKVPYPENHDEKHSQAFLSKHTGENTNFELTPTTVGVKWGYNFTHKLQ